MPTIRQITTYLERSFKNWDYKRAIQLSDNEAKTRDYLIEPILNMLGYNKMDHYSHEYSLKISTGHIKKVDMVITIKGKSPIMLIECKKSNSNLTKRNFTQLSEYFTHHRESKLGILTNGVIYEFYTLKWDNSNKLHNKPFLTFNLNEFTSADLEDLSLLHRDKFNIKKIMNIAEERYFLNDFDKALLNTLYPPSDELIKSIFRNMGGGSRLTEKIRRRIFELINSISIDQALKKVRLRESINSKSGVVTTAEEIKSFQIIKTILAMSSKINNNDLDRINYKDYKGQFKIIIDNMPSKQICYLVLNKNKKSININSTEFFLDSISSKEITKLKKHIINQAEKYLRNRK